MSDSLFTSTTAAFGRVEPKNAYTLVVMSQENKEVVRIQKDGRIFWHGREVETDDDFRSAMMELRDALRGKR